MNSPNEDIIEEEPSSNLKQGKKKPRRVSVSIKDVPRPFYHIKDPMVREQFQAPLPTIIKNTSFDYVIKPPKSGLVAPPPTPSATPSVSAKKIATKKGDLSAITENPELKIKEMEGRLNRTKERLVKAESSLIRAEDGKTAKGKPFRSENRRLAAIKGIQSEIERYRNMITQFETEINKLETVQEEVEEEVEEPVVSTQSSLSGYIPFNPP
jgi:DNA repair exonuclease SbcCD ATPase subunit